MSKGVEYLNGPFKRGLDILGAMALGGFGAPAAVIGAAVLKFDLGVPLKDIIYKQQRRGKGGEPFTIYKLMTMIPGEGPIETRGAYDSRAGKHALKIRAWGIDEIPQAWNILGGDLSLIGPRALLERDHDMLKQIDPALFKDWQEACDQVRGGVYAPSQNLRRAHPEHTNEMWAECMRLDITYVETATFGGDVDLMLSAPGAIARAVRAGRAATEQ